MFSLGALCIYINLEVLSTQLRCLTCCFILRIKLSGYETSICTDYPTSAWFLIFPCCSFNEKLGVKISLIIT